MITAPGVWAGSLNFIVEDEVFSRNIETQNLSNEIRDLDGQTPTGNIMKTYFHYQIDRRSSIEVGALLNMPFGQKDKVLTADPIISFKYYLRPTWWYTFGTIDREHPVLDAFVDDIRAFDDPNENGFQLQADNKVIKQDLWLDWRINEESAQAENFTLGNYTQLKYKGFMVDFQLLWFHFGGQRNNVPGVSNNVSTAFGTGYTFYPKNTSFLDEIGFSIHYLTVKNRPAPLNIAACSIKGDRTCDIKGDEDGVEGKLFGHFKGVYFHFLFWEGGGREFLSSRGDPIYQLERFQEFMIGKTWRLSDSAAITASFQFINNGDGTMWLENLVSLEWRFDVPLFRDYFKDLRKQKKIAKARKSKRRPARKKRK